MKSFSGHLYIFVLLFIMLAGSYGCEKKQDTEPPLAKPTAGVKTDSDIAELLSSLNMYHFSEPVEAPSFELPSINGKMVNLSQFKGKVVLISFWATW
jgi:thiol-disulfide isomerase/thioredoxin